MIEHFFTVPFDFTTLPEINQSKSRHKETVNGKARQGGSIQELQEPEDGSIGHHEGSDKAHRQHAQVTDRETSNDFKKVIEAGQEHEGYCHNESKVGACLPGNAQKKTACNSTAAPGEAGPQGEALEEADNKRLFRGNLIHIGHSKFLSLSCLFRHNHENAAQYQADDDGGRTEETVLDEAVEKKAHKTGREHGNADIKYRRPFPAEPVMGIQNIGKLFMIHHQHRKDGAQLDKYIKKVCQGSFKAQHMAHNNHMTCRRNRNIFRKPFYNAHNQSTEIFVHSNTSNGSLLRGIHGIHNAFHLIL